MDITNQNYIRGTLVKRVIVFSDSQAALKRIRTDKIGPGQTLAKEIIAQATKLVESDIRIILRWVPSHIGIKGNEKADIIAKKAAENGLAAPENRYCSLSHITRLVKSRKLLETKE
jgi:ribonuclease HI